MEINYITIRYNVSGAERKRLADYIAGFLGCEKKYLGMPNCAYQVGYIEVGKDGAISFDDRADSEEIETLLEELENEGFQAEPAAGTNDGDTTTAAPVPTLSVESDERTAESMARPDKAAANCEAGETFNEEFDGSPQNTPVGLTVSIPLYKVKLGNLTALLDAKGALIRKALAIPATPIEVGMDAVTFPWFDTIPDADTANAYTAFIAALCKASCERKRVTAKAKTVDNEKYAFRCFLLNLGFIGDEYKTARRILLKNLSGNVAFKSGMKTQQ